MTETIISLLSILLGILGATLFGWLKPKYSFGFTGNTIVGVFSSILIIKFFGRLGFAPNAIVNKQVIDYTLLVLNLSISFTSGVLGLYTAYKIKTITPKK